MSATTPLPESAVELAALAIFREEIGLTDAEVDEVWADHEEAYREHYRRMARIAIHYALPAIREAVVAEMKVGLLRETLGRAEEYLPIPPDRNCSCHLSPPCGDCVDFSDLRDLHETIRAALTEQENRNG